MEFEDPEIVATVQQYLYEHGLTVTLKAFEQEIGAEAFDPHSIVTGSKLESIMNEYKESSLQKQLQHIELDDKETNEKLLEKGDGHFVRFMLRSLDNIHLGNILCVAFSHEKGTKIIATGSTDKLVKLTNYETKELLSEFSVHKGAVLSLSFNPVYTHLLLSASMDGSCALIDTKNSAVLQEFREHNKYVVAAKWSHDGLSFATASHDHSACLFKAHDISSPFVKVEKYLFHTNVETISFNDKGLLAIGVREDNYLHLVDTHTLKRTKFNLNAKQDDHVSFTAMHITFWDENLILVSTDRDRLIMYRIGNSSPLRNFWGAPNDSFSNPRNAWDPSRKYVYSSAQNHKIYVWEVSSQTVVHKLEGHTGIIRDLCFHPHEKMIASCSFDKSVKLWVAQ